MDTSKIISMLRSGAPFVTIFNLLKGQLDDKMHADALYGDLIPVLHDYLMEGRRFNDPRVQNIVNILRELPAYGARRRNFENLYLKDEYTLRKLPKDPKKIPYGHWH